MVLAAGRSSLPMLAEAIVGHPIRGSWMADPEVFRIHRLMRRVHRTPGLVTAALIQGKATLFDAPLGPAVQRIAGDDTRRGAAIQQIPPMARALLRDVESSGEVRMDRWRASSAAGRDARMRLVEQWLVATASIHTESGYHTALVRPWQASAIANRYAKPAARLDYAEACRRLWMTAVRSAVIVPEREALHWFPFAEAGLGDLISDGEVTRVRSGGRYWLTCEQ
ncbi:MAG: hypothetical protein ACRDFT_04985 [bacterium]